MTDKDLKVNDEKETLVDKEGLDVDQLMLEYDKDTSKLRQLGGPVGMIVSVLAIAMSLFHLYTAGFGTLLSFKQRSLHIMFAFVLGLMLFPATAKSDKKKPSILDYLLVGLVLVVFGYIFIFTETVMLKGGKAETLDLILGGLAILLTLEVTRRVV